MFPYFLTLIILFVGIMLSSTLVVMEKKSKAFFKTFTTPTSGMYHLIGGYLTNITILFGQLAVILGASFYYLKIALFDNIGVTLVILALSVTFFVLLGTLIGHVFRSQEGTTIASISVGTLFLFLSNVVLPVESFPTIIRKIISSTPYMLSAELIKQSVLFNVGFGELSQELILLSSYVVIVAVLVLVFRKLSYTRFFEGSANRKTLRKPHVTKDNSFRFNDGSIARNKKDLLSVLKRMNNDEFYDYVDKKNNELALWLKDTFKDKKTAHQLKKAKSREEAVAVLSGNLRLSQPLNTKEDVQPETKPAKRSFLPKVRFSWGHEKETFQTPQQEEVKVKKTVKKKRAKSKTKSSKSSTVETKPVKKQKVVKNKIQKNKVQKKETQKKENKENKQNQSSLPPENTENKENIDNQQQNLNLPNNSEPSESETENFNL